MTPKRIILALTSLLLTIAAAGVSVLRLEAQEPSGPQTPPKPPEIVRIPTRSGAPTEQPPIAAVEIIRRFSAQEDQLARLFTSYSYRKMVRLEELGADGKVAGQAEISSSSLPVSDDARRKAAGESQSTLRFLNLERDDIEALSKIPAFPLVSSNLSKYELTYQGKQLLPKTAKHDLSYNDPFFTTCWQSCHSFQARMAPHTFDLDGWRQRVVYMRDVMLEGYTRPDRIYALDEGEVRIGAEPAD